MGAEGYGGAEQMGGGGGSGGAILTLAQAYANGASSSDSQMTIDVTRGGVVVSASALTGIVPVTVTLNNASTSGAEKAFAVTGTFNPTSGNATYTPVSITYTVNQTGGANGTVTGIKVTATETAVVGTHNLLDLAIGVTSKFTVDHTGAVTAEGNIRLDALGSTGLVKNTNGSTLSIAVAGTDYVYPGGISGGQVITGGTAASDKLDLISTTNGTKGQIRVGGTTDGVIYDGLNKRLGIGAASSSESLEIHGGAVAFTGTAGFNGSGTGIYGQSASAFLGFVVAGSEVARIDGTAGNNLVWKGGSFLLGNSAIATNATDGFPYIRGGSGAPTGVPTSHTGVYALYWDHTNKKLYIYDGAWLGGTAPGVWS